MDRPSYRIATITYFCFLLSGAAGLVFEVVWSRMLSLLVGMTTLAHASVISAYMLGLGLGAWVFGRISDRHRAPLRLFAMLELGVAAYAAVTPWLAEGLRHAYAGFSASLDIYGLPSHLLRFLCGLVLLLPATFLMGGALPAVIRGVAFRMEGFGAATARLYGINALGAALGALAAGYILIPQLGMKGALYAGVALDVLVVAVITLGVRGQPVPEKVSSGRPGESRVPGGRLLLVLFAVSGFAAMACQAAWLRALVMVLGSSIYSFTITLSVFLAGLGLGSMLYTRKTGGSVEESRHMRNVFLLMTGAGLTALAGLKAIAWLPLAFLWGVQQGWGPQFGVFQAYLFFLCFLIMVLPTACLGALFPAMSVIRVRRMEILGRGIGSLYAANTIGCILGAALSGILLVPRLGVHGTIFLAAGLHVLAGIAVARVGLLPRSGVAALLAVAGYAVTALFVPEWDRQVMTSGVYLQDTTASGRSPYDVLADRIKNRRMLFYREGREGVVSVVESGDQRLLMINGKVDASSGRDLPTQMMLGHLPMLVHPDPKNVLVIGFGSGATAASVALHPGVEQIDILEISREVIEAAPWFHDVNRHVLEDDRVRLILADARNYLLGRKEKYDVIISEPSNPWITGISSLFTREFFRILNQRLAPGGIVCQWFHIYNMSDEDTRSVFHSYRDGFSHVSIWQSMGTDLFMLGSEDPHALDAQRLASTWKNRPLLADLEKAENNSLDRIAGMFLIGGESLDGYAGTAPYNTDNNPRIEFNAPQNLYRAYAGEVLEKLVSHLEGQPSEPPVEGVAVVTPAGLEMPAHGISIRESEVMVSWSAGVHVWKKMMAVGPGQGTSLGVGSQSRVEWVTASARNQIMIFSTVQELELSKLAEYLLSYQGGEPLSNGALKLPGGVEAAWLLTRLPEEPLVRYGIAWVQQAPGGGLQQCYAVRDMRDPGEASREAALAALANSFGPPGP